MTDAQKTESVDMVHSLDLGDGVNYTVTITENPGNADGSDDLISVKDSRDDAAIVRRLPKVPDVKQNLQLMMDMVVDGTALDFTGSYSQVPSLIAGSIWTSAAPGSRRGDAYGNTFELVYRKDSGDRYAPALVLAFVDPDFAASLFIDFVRVGAQALIDANTRVAAHGTHLRNAKSDMAKLDRESRAREAAARDLVESLSTSREFHRAHAGLRAHQVSIMRKVLIQYASPDSWTGDPEGVKNKLASNIDGFSLAQQALANVTMDDVE